MAIIRLTNNQQITVSKERAHEAWAVLNGEIEGTEEQQEFCTKIKKIHFNWRSAPDSWVEQNMDMMREKFRDEWYVDNQGNPTRPQYKKDWDLKNKWGL